MIGDDGSIDLSSLPVRASLAAASIVVLVLAGTPGAAADALSSRVAAARGAPLPIESSVDAAAQASARRQADAGELGHSSLGGLGCSSAGEVVGSGPGIDAIWAGFRASGSHWSLITQPGWTSMGTGVATTDEGTVYVAVIFCRRDGETAPTPPPDDPGQPVSEQLPSVSSSSHGSAGGRAPAEVSPTYVDFLQRWLDAMEVAVATEFGAAQPPVARDGELVAAIPVVV